MLMHHNIQNNLEDASMYQRILTSLLLEEIVLRKTKNTFLEELIPKNAPGERELRGLLGGSKATSNSSEQIVNLHDYFLQQTITVKNAPLAENDELSDQLIDFLNQAEEYSIPISKEEPGYLLGPEIRNNAFFLAQKKSDFLSKDGYLGFIVSNIKRNKGYKGDLSIISSQYLGDGKFMANSLQGLRLNTQEALLNKNMPYTNLKDKIARAIINRKELFNEVRNYIFSKKNNSDVETMKILTGKRIPYR